MSKVAFEVLKRQTEFRDALGKSGLRQKEENLAFAFYKSHVHVQESAAQLPKIAYSPPLLRQFQVIGM